MSARAKASALVLAVAGLLVAAAPALGAPAWRLVSLANTTVAPGGTLDYFVDATNVGDSAMDGSQVTLTATLPAHITAVSASVLDLSRGHAYACFDARDGVSPVAGATTVVCRDSEPDPTLQMQKLSLRVRADAGAAGTLTTSFSVAGGGAAPASTVDPTRVSDTPPAFGIDAFDGQVGDASGQPFTQAGGHPYAASVSIDFNTLTNPLPMLGALWPVEPVKDVLTDLPAGLIGNPTAADTCTLPDLAHAAAESGFDAQPLCSPTSQVGTTVVRLKGIGQGGGSEVLGPLPVYNLVPPPGAPAQFGFNVVGSVVVLNGGVRSGGDYGISVDAQNLPEGLAIVGTSVTFWGVPADPSHDAERACPGSEPPSNFGPSCSNGGPLRPLLRLPTSCTDAGVGLPTTARIDSWTHPGVYDQRTWFSHLPPGYPAAPEDWGAEVGPTGCDRVPFDPVLTAQPTPATAGSPTGFVFELSLPQSDDPTVVGESDLKSATVTLPEGVRVSPPSAAGLQGCSSAQIALRSDAAPACPDGSKLGSVTIATPLLRVPVTGAIYLATPFDNPSHSLISIYLVASAQGVTIKLAGQGALNPSTGQISATFDDNPQLPFSDLRLQFDGGARAPLALPNRCGTYTTHAVLTGWNGRTVESDSSFTVSQDAQGRPCPVQFKPALRAGTQDPNAGAHTPFHLQLTRGDSDDELKSISLQTPPGLLGQLNSTTLCADSDVATDNCPASSLIGHVTVGAGAGSNPFYIQDGRAYITGPYKGAPFGLAFVVPAVAGPFDLGNVTVRAKVEVDPQTAQLKVTSDPLPTILQGIPLDVRDVRVAIDRPGFIFNPTNCAQLAITGQVSAVTDRSADVQAPFSVTNCAALGYSPKLALALTGKGQTTDGKHPALHALLATTKRQANTKKATVTLPLSLALDPNNAQALCTPDQYAARSCPAASIVGHARANSILHVPLEGPVYFVEGTRTDAKGRVHKTLPKLWIPLQGEGVTIDVNASSAVTAQNKLVTTFDNLPDAPFSSFELQIDGGRHGILVVSNANICKHKQVAATEFDAQDGAASRPNVTMTTTAACTGAHKAPRRQPAKRSRTRAHH